SFSCLMERSRCQPYSRAEYVLDNLRFTVFGRFTLTVAPRTNTDYPHLFTRISSSAFLLLVWHLTTSALHLPASSTAQRTILWDTVFVKSTIRSGLPICLPRLADIWVNTFALQLNRLQICLY